ncbi:monocarboxylate transporter 12 [Parasteatoda tepidariorum]|uniref:monocarboxylate transporter 12 n=1 Tax=Parasteatoda tepidariorum TaxID=114398 RepID=UPI00077F9876|nr:monocarboxylate transporter 12 [Parasteatoda tepidariorum]XP_015914469.1 monocarboxylate transporter 12 [Parasteatoda tepidariorum]
MDSTLIKSGENVDTNDSNFNKTLYKKENSNNIKCSNKNKPTYQASNRSLSSSSSSSSGAPESSLPPPPDGGWGWVVVFASFMINFIADGVSLSFGILFVDFINYFGESKAKTSMVGSIFLSMPLLAGPVASYLIDRYGCQRMCILGALLSTISFVISVCADSLEILILTFTLAGIGLALCYVTSIVVVAYYFEKKRSLATGLAACGTGIGNFVFPPLTRYLIEQYAWQGTLLILSGFFLNMIVFGALMRDLESPADEENDKADDSSESCNLDNTERLCSSMVQLPTYLSNNFPEVISELSSKEGSHLNSLLEQHPYILDSYVKKYSIDSTESSLAQEKGEKALKKKTRKDLAKTFSNSSTRESSVPPRLDAAYLHKIRLQRGSITYRGAMLNIHRYRLKASSCPDIYRNSMVTINEEKGCMFLDDLKILICEMFDFTNFKNIGYTIFCLSNFFLYACVDVPYVYIPDHAVNSGTDMNDASYLISILGVLNCLGVVTVGYIGDKPWIDSTLLYSGFILLSGLSLALLPIVANYYVIASLVGIYGFTISANYTLVPVIIVNLISLDNFTGAYGLLLLVQGKASLIGPPVAGWLFDVTGNYDITFYVTGLLIMLSGAMVIPVSKNLCRKASPISSKSSIRSDSRKVKFQDNPGNVDNVLEGKLENRLNDKKVYKSKETGDNTTPLLSTNNKEICIEKCNGNGSKSISVYENPLSLV